MEELQVRTPNKGNIRLWVKALRSGGFAQGKNSLRTEKGYCCLGVACDLYHNHTGEGGWVADGLKFFFRFGTDFYLLPVVVQDWLGVDECPHIRQGSDITLAHLNDNGANFVVIADLIEERYLPEDIAARKNNAGI